jgi:hypothetical protein
MSTIKVHTYPQGQQLSNGEHIQVQVKISGVLVFKDAYFHELQDGDKYIIPEQVQLPLASDIEILDYIIDNQDTLAFSIYERQDDTSEVYCYEKEKLNQIASVFTGKHPLKSEIRGAFRELMSQVIHNDKL